MTVVFLTLAVLAQGGGGIPAYTPEHKSAWNHNYTNYLTLILTCQRPAQKL